MQAKIFISHSCKDLEWGIVDQQDAEQVAKWRRLQFARIVREKVVDGLEGMRYKVLLDLNRLEPGDEWRAKLHGWLGSCHGAVLLLSQDSIGSEWVQKEATILTWRKSLLRELLVVPVFLGDLQMEALKTHGLECLQLTEIQAVRLAPNDIPGGGCKVEDLSDEAFDTHATYLAQKVLAAFQGLAAINSGTEMEEEWVKNVTGRLQEVKPIFLDSARKELKIPDQDWSDDVGYLAVHDLLGQTAILAHQLLNADLDRLRLAMNAIRQGVTQETYEWLVRRVACQWVDVRAAHKLLPGARPPYLKEAESRLLFLNATYEETCQAYIDRANCCKLNASRVIFVSKPIGEAFAQELSHHIERNLFKKLLLPKRFLVESRETGNQGDHLERREGIIEERLKGTPFYIVLDVGEEGELNGKVLENIRTARKNITYVLLTGKNFPTLQPGIEEIEYLLPELTIEKEDKAEILRETLLDMAD